MSREAKEPAGRTPGEMLRQRYEDLRSLVLSGAPAWEQAAGVGALLGCGMRDWMERGTPPPGTPRGHVASVHRKPALEPAQARLGAVIAEMILAPLRRAIP